MNNCLKKIIEKYRYQVDLCVVFLLCVLISSVINRADINGAMRFWGFMVCGVIIPGAAVVSVLRIDGLNQLETLLVSYVVGYVISIIVYSAATLLAIDSFLFHISIGIILISLLVIWIRRNQEICSGGGSQRREKSWICLILLLCSFSLIVFSLKNALPIFLGHNSWHNDLLYWLGDIVALTHNIPPVDFRTLGSDYFYHFFGALQIASMKKVTGIPTAEIAIQYSYIVSMVMLGLSSFCLIKRVIKNQAWIITLFLLLFSTGIENKTGVTFFWHIYQIPMSFNIAISLEMVIILLLIIQIEKEKLDCNVLFYLLLFLLICTGTKGPSGAIVLCGIGMACIYWMVVKKEYNKAICYGVLAIVIFGGIYTLLLMPGNSAYIENASYVDPYTIGLNNTLIENCKIIIWKTIKYFRYFIYINPWTFVPAGIYICYSLIKKRLKLEDTIFLLMIIIGTVLGYVMHYYGNSEIYFSLSVFPFAAILSGKFWEIVYTFFEIKDRKSYSLDLGILLMIVIIIFFNFEWNWKNTLQTSLINGLQVMEGKAPLYDRNKNMMTNEEYKAYTWIRNNTDYNAIFLSDRSLEEEEFCYIPGVFAERYIYNYIVNDEIEIAKESFKGEKEAMEYFINKGIKYYIQNIRISPYFSCNKAYGEKIYENDEVVVWEMKETILK